MINTFCIAGKIQKICISVPKDPSKPESAIVFVQYSAQRESTNSLVEFVHAVMIRIPNAKFPSLKAQLTVGCTVHVNGHLQGVQKKGFTHLITELVADRIDIAGDTD